MLFVAFRYYQQSLQTEEWEEEEEEVEVEEGEATCQVSIGKGKYGSGTLFGGMSRGKQKKKF